MSQEDPAGQSAGPWQPHAPERQAWPLALLEQSTHKVPVAQVVAELPATQAPAEVQQPPLHGWLTSQLVEHLPLRHACPVGQSPAL